MGLHVEIGRAPVIFPTSPSLMRARREWDQLVLAVLRWKLFSELKLRSGIIFNEVMSVADPLGYK